MSSENEHVSLPRLYGAPDTSRRRMAAMATETPMGPDDLPIESSRSAEEQALALELFPRAYTSQVLDAAALREASRAARTPDAQLRARPLNLRALAGRLLRPKGH